MRKAFNCYAGGLVKISKTEINPEDFGIDKTGIGQWSFSDCLDFDGESWRYSLPMECPVEITHNYDAELKQMNIEVKKDGILFDCRGFTIALNYEDVGEDLIDV